MGKKIVIVAGSGDFTGACKMAYYYGCEFRNLGWSVCFIVGDPPLDGSTRIADVLHDADFNVYEETGFFKLRSRSLIKKVKEIVADYKPDVVISCVQVDLKIVGPACRSLDVPYIVFDQNLHHFYGLPMIRWAKKVFFGRELRKALGVIAVGPAVSRQLISQFGCRDDSVVVVANGIDLSSSNFDSISIRSLSTENTENVKCINVGRIDPQKGQLVLIEALSLVPNLEVSFAGGVTLWSLDSVLYEKKLRTYLKNAQFSSLVDFLGWRNDVSTLFSQYDFYVHPSLWEGPPLTLSILEAMAQGLPIIMSDCSGRPEGFIDGFHGRVVESGNVEKLADAMKWMSEMSSSERQRIGDNCRRFCLENYDIKVTGNRFVSVVEKMISRS